ncbi:uncharacterized protein LOC114430271 isoform X2 [Parambassis ranga]|uniref:Uncharacterized protein LOC114430271 isoform X2 n=1 Tax=Parambassis ranga TaxID=210632 RepID=A0A6P7HQY6_9TELE|nr:uncharacterized protein LOC114430271 isoform X2 [Parambassis ranga]
MYSTHRLSARLWTKPRRNSTSSLVKLGKSLTSWTNCRSPVCLKSARTMWEDRGLCRGSGRPLPKQSPPNSFPSTSSRMCSHMVAVSFLLVLCICALMIAALYVWQQRQADRKSHRLVCPEEGSKNNNCLEICSLSSPEDPGPDLKVVE